MSGSNTHNNAHALSNATALFFCWSLSTFAARAWVKLRRSERWGKDDSMITAALVFSLFHVASIFWAVHAGYGVAYTSFTYETREQIFKALYASEFFYIVSIGSSKVSTGLFISHLTRYGPQAKCAYALTTICALWIFTSLFVVAFRGQVNQPWQFLDGSNVMFVRWMIIEVTGLVVEIALWCLCVDIIWTLNMALHKRCIILAIFGCRLLLIPLVTLRLFWLSPSKNPDPATPALMADIFTEAVLQAAFISASITCLKPFLKPFASTFMDNSDENSRRKWPSNQNPNAKDPYYVLSTIRDVEKDGTVVSALHDEEVVNFSRKETRSAQKSFRPNNFDQAATISACPRNSSMEETSNSMTIRKTESWSVRIEGNAFNSDEVGKRSSPSYSRMPDGAFSPTNVI